MSHANLGAATESGRSFMQGASGAWAGKQLLKAMKAGRPISAAELRTCDTLRKDEWVSFDEALIEEGTIRLRGIADLLAAGLTISIPNAMGKTIHEWENVTDMEPAVVSLDGLARGDNDRQEYNLGSIPLPITHKDFNIGIRTLSASRERGEALDTTQVRTAGRLVAEKLEAMLFNGLSNQFGGKSIQGYTTHQYRNTGSFTSGHWNDLADADVGAAALKDVLTMRTGLKEARFYGPYWLYVPSNFDGALEKDFKANSDKTVRQRLLEVDGLDRIQVVDQLADDNLVMVQGTRDVVALLNGETLQTIQWDLYGGLAVAFKAFAIQVPLIRADAQNRSGVYHMS